MERPTTPVKLIMTEYNAAGWKVQTYQDADGQYWEAAQDGLDCLWSKVDFAAETSCYSCHGGGWVHIDLEHADIPDGVYNCDCMFGQSITHEVVMERHKEQCGCKEYGLPKSDEE